MSRQEAVKQYSIAWKRGLKFYKNAQALGAYPYPPVLDELLNESQSAGRMELGLVDIPSDLIVGTRSAGRRNAFAGNFMPLLSPESEFGAKWIHLCEAHLGEEGIREPIRCCEYLGRFYVVEGNKRVSVLKSFDAPSIPGLVTRILPVYVDTPEVQLYYEFLQFYQRCSLYAVRFSRLGSYEKLQKSMGYDRDHIWTLEEKRSFLSLLSVFQNVYDKLGGEKLSGTVCDALLGCLQVFSFSELKSKSSEELGKTLEGLWADIEEAPLSRPISVSTAPEGEDKGLINRILGVARPDHLSVAFVYANDPQVSAWARGHIQGEHDLAQELGAKISVKKYWALRHDYDQALEQAAKDGAEIIFATTPQMISSCRRVAALYPKIRVLTCALSKPYMGLRSYYSRTYEAKFVTGVIAGTMAENDRIGYIASYPIVGIPAEINAFALGAQMTNPRARVELLWTSQTDDPLLQLLEDGVTVISNRDASHPRHSKWAMDWGTYHLREDGSVAPLAVPCWDWGKFYIQVVQSVFNGSYDALARGQNPQPINYWWGMSGGVIDVQLSPSLPEGVRRMAEHICSDLRGGWIDPFRCRIKDQSGQLRNDGAGGLSMEELIRMDWLCENVDGRIPEIEELKPEAVETSKVLAIRPEQTEEKETNG